MNDNQKEKARIRAKEWYKNNKERALASVKLRALNPVVKIQIKEWRKEYNILNQNKIKKRLNDWYKGHRELMKNRARVWKQKNPERAQYLRNTKKSI